MSFRSVKNETALFWLTLLLAVLDRAVIVAVFGFHYTDSDQGMFWMGGWDYAHGQFHEPCVYGQNYLYLLESLVAAPFLRLGFAAWHVFPIVTSALALAPYFAFALYYRTRDLAAACVFAAIPILLPAEFGMQTTSTHGLVNGLFLTAFFPLIWQVRQTNLRSFLAGCAAGLGFMLAQNSAPAMAVLIVLTLFRQSRSWISWGYLVLGILPSIILSSLVAIYYAQHPPIHSLGPAMLKFQPDAFLRHLIHLDKYFLWMCPLVWRHGGLSLVLLLALSGVLLWKRRFAEAVAVLAALGLILASLGLPKVDDGTEWVCFAYSRLYLAVPLLLGIAFSLCSDLIRKPALFAVGLLFLCAGSFGLKCFVLNDAIDRQVRSPEEMLKVRSIVDVKQRCGRIDSLARGGANLVVALPPINCSYADAAFYCYGANLIYPDYPKTLIYGFERRSWRVEEESTNVNKNILFVGGSQAGWKTLAGPDVKDCFDSVAVVHLVHNSKALSTRELLQNLKPVMR